MNFDGRRGSPSPLEDPLHVRDTIVARLSVLRQHLRGFAIMATEVFSNLSLRKPVGTIKYNHADVMWGLWGSM